MAEAIEPRVSQRRHDDVDLVRHLYNRRANWGTDTVLYRKKHPMEWKRVVGNYQNWEIDTRSIVPTDAESPRGEPACLLSSDDLTFWLSRRRESMPFFFRNCDADELHLISSGQMTYETDFGAIDVRDRDFLLIPKGVTYRVLLPRPQDTLRAIFESRPEIFLVPTEMVEDIYHKGRPAVGEDRLQRPKLVHELPVGNEFEVRVKYSGAFADFLGNISTIVYDHYPLDTELIDGVEPVVKFSVADIEKLGSTPVPFVGGAYLDNRASRAWTLHLAGGGGGTAPVHRNADVDEMRYFSSGPKMGNILFTPQGVDHGAGRGYTKRDRNRPEEDYDLGDTISAYTVKPLKGTPLAHGVARAYMC
jgi:homogentisate 1,2-dioxygenase